MNPADDELPLDEALSFLQHLWKLNHSLERLSRRMEQAIGISAPQRFIVRCVGKYPGMTAGQLARILHLDPGSVSSALRKLEHLGILERRQDPRDRRRVTLGLTAKGRSLDRPFTGTVESAVTQTLAAAGRRETNSAMTTLRTLAAALDRELPKAAK